MRLRQIDTDPRDVPAIPNTAVAIAETEVVAMRVMKTAAQDEANQIKADINDRSGTLSASVGSSVRRVPGGGVSVRFGAIKKVAFMSRKGSRVGREQYGAEGGKTKKQNVFHGDFVDRGTGTRGPLHKKIQRTGLIRVGRTVRKPSGVGQAPQGMFRRARERWVAKAPIADELIEDEFTRNIERRR